MAAHAPNGEGVYMLAIDDGCNKCRNGNAMYDYEGKQYLEPVIDPYSYVFDELNEYLESDCGDFLQEL